MKVLDLFSGAGGLSLGFTQAGYDVVAGVDHDVDALATFRSLHPSALAVRADLSEQNALQAIEALPNSDLVVGGPPCQGFSIAGKRVIDDERNRLYRGFWRVVETTRPKAFVMENVPNLLSMAAGVVFDRIVRDFKALDYKLSWKVLNAADFGVPQARKRLFVVGVMNQEFSFPEGGSNPISALRAIGDLPEESLDNASPYPSEPKSTYQELMRIGSDGVWNHQTTAHHERTVRIISMVPDGGNYKDLPHHLQNTRRVNIAWTRLSSERPSPTIDTGHRHHFHYHYNRVPTVRESARIQSFPDRVRFSGSKTSQSRQVGNAVPPLLAQAIGIALREQIW